jgi:hypothetical protein
MMSFSRTQRIGTLGSTLVSERFNTNDSTSQGSPKAVGALKWKAQLKTSTDMGYPTTSARSSYNMFSETLNTSLI